jgi:hypothetical protein
MCTDEYAVRPAREIARDMATPIQMHAFVSDVTEFELSSIPLRAIRFTKGRIAKAAGQQPTHVL